MAISATFRADFTQFSDAVAKAEVQLKSFESGAGRVEKSLSRMVDNFSGRKLIQEATLMTSAIERAGGVSVLTGSELQAVGTKAAEAAEKMRKLGLDVPPGLQEIAKHAAPIPGLFSKITQVLGPLGTAIGVTFSVGALVSFGKALFADADALVKLSDKTGISTTGLQKFRVAGDEAGNTLDEITGAVTQMQNRLAGGDQSALKALDQMGVRLNDIKTLAPDQQFMAIAAAIRQIQDPAQQVAAAVDVFGRTGASVLPTIKRGFEDLGDGIGIVSDEATRALDRTGDAIVSLWRKTKAAVSEAVGGTLSARAAMEAEAARILKAQQMTTQEAADLLTSLVERAQAVIAIQQTVPTLGPKIDPFEMENAARLIQKDADALAKMAREAEAAAEADARLRQEVRRLETAFPGVITQLGLADTREHDLMVSTMRLREQVQLLERANASFSSIPFLGGLESLGEKVIPTMADIGMVGEEGGDAFVGAFRDTLVSGLPGAIASGFTGDSLSQIASTGASAIGSIVGGAIAGPIGAAIGSSILQAISAAGSNSRVANLVKASNLKGEFVQLHGGMEQLILDAQRAGVAVSDLQKVFSARNPTEFALAVEKVNQALSFQDSAMQQLDEAVERYGFDLASLGPTFGGAKLSEQAQQIYKDFGLLSAAAVDHNEILSHMAPSMKTFLDQSKAAGVAVPRELKNIVDEMIRLGYITDADGNKFENAEDAGITFADNLSDVFRDEVIPALQDLADAIRRSLIDPLKDAESQARDTAAAVAAIAGAQSAAAIVLGRAQGAVPMASGGSGRVSKPTLFLAGEAGPEEYAFSGGGRSFSGGSSGAALLAEMAGLRAEFRRLPELLALHLRAAMAVS